MDKLEKIVADARSAFERAADLAQLEQAKARFLGKTGALTEQLKGLGKLPAGERIISAGIRYSNIDPDQEMSAEPRPTGVSARPSRNQCDNGTSPLAIEIKLVSRASEASRS